MLYYYTGSCNIFIVLVSEEHVSLFVGWPFVRRARETPRNSGFKPRLSGCKLMRPLYWEYTPNLHRAGRYTKGIFILAPLLPKVIDYRSIYSMWSNQVSHWNDEVVPIVVRLKHDSIMFQPLAIKLKSIQNHCEPVKQCKTWLHLSLSLEYESAMLLKCVSFNTY